MLNPTINNDSIEDVNCVATLNIHTEHPSVNEIKAAIKRLKNNKAAGPDNIYAEMLKVNVSTITPYLYNIFKELWIKKEIPSSWKEGIIVKLPKKVT